MDSEITPAKPADVPGLLEMIRELANFERLEVVATTTSLHDSLFGPKPVVSALVAHAGDELAGYALYFFTFSSFLGRAGIWLEDLYVRPRFRHQGIGRGLIEAVAQVGAERNCGRFEWSALDWNQNALEFYKKLGAQALDDWVILRLDAAGLKRLAGKNAPVPQ